MKIIFLGTGTTSLRRDSTSLLIQTDSTNLLIDSCSSILNKLNQLNLKPTDLDGIIITHDHGDHIWGFPWLLTEAIVDTFIFKRVEPKKIKTLASPETVEKITKIIELSHKLIAQQIPNILDLHNIKETSEIVFNDDILVKPFPVNHSGETYGLVIQVEGKKIVFSSDTRPLDSMLEYAKGADILIHTALTGQDKKFVAERLMHSTSEEAAKIAKESNVKKLVLVHIHDSLYSTDDEKMYLNEANNIFEGDVLLPKDMETIEL